jgi:hypothetical protein
LRDICYYENPMLGLRRFIRSRRSGAWLSICVAYTLAIQALMVSVGVGMSAAAEADGTALVICNHAPASPDDPQKPNSAPQCAFCFIAAQTSNNVLVAGDAPALPPYATLPITTMPDRHGERVFIPQLRRTAGDPRGPPRFSV